MHKVSDLIALREKDSFTGRVVNALMQDYNELMAIRKPSTPEGKASVFEELNKKAKAVAYRTNHVYKQDKNKQVRPDFFIEYMTVAKPDIIKAFISTKKNMSRNRQLLSQYPEICVKSKGFADLKAALALPTVIKRANALSELMTGDKRVVRKPRLEAVDDFYIHNNYRLVYNVVGDPIDKFNVNKIKSKGGKK